ncbi:MAG: winged helix DNA-binding domain-containing protein, partial [Anaerolineae bacterium]|nr:winged helix DNA-binding domain-containing protein [Anaerolineae bacterium]
MTERTLTLRELNRALLARQMLLARETLPVPAAVERLVGMQAQLASAPFVGLWTRLNNFTRADLAGAVD